MGNTKMYSRDVTVNLIATGAIVEGLLYGVNGTGNPVLADRATPISVVGFAVKGLTAAEGAAGKAAAFTRHGIVELVAAEIAGGTFTIGANVYLDTAGKYTTTKPSTATNILQYVGVAISTTKVAVYVSPPLVITAAASGTLSP
jgi:hypothetical protein